MLAIAVIAIAVIGKAVSTYYETGPEVSCRTDGRSVMLLWPPEGTEGLQIDSASQIDNSALWRAVFASVFARLTCWLDILFYVIIIIIFIYIQYIESPLGVNADRCCHKYFL